MVTSEPSCNHIPSNLHYNNSRFNLSEMTENLYESSQFTNHTNGNYMFQHSPSAPHYGVSNVSSIHSSPMSPRLNHEHLASPVTPGNELSPLLDMPNSAGTWDYNQFGRGSSWSSQDESTESGGVSGMHPFNVTCLNESTATSKDGGGAVFSQRLDSFSKVFPSKNIHLLFQDNNNRTVDKSSGSGLTLPQSGTFSGGSERQLLGFNPMAIQCQTQTMSDHTSFHLSDQNPLHGLYQNPQHFQYGYQQHKQKVTHVDQTKPQSPWLHQHTYPSHLPSFPMNLNQQHHVHLQPRGTFPHKTHLDCQENHEPTQSPTYSHGQDFKSPEEQNFQSLLSPHYQDQQYIHPFSHPSGVYLHQHSQEHVKQSDVFHDGHLQPYDKHSAPNTPVFSSPKDDGQFNFNTQRSEDICSPRYSNKSSGVNKGVSQTHTFPHLPSHASQWSQASSPDIQSETISHYRAENGPVRAEGSQARMRCTVCQREFKSLPALNGHMRSHGGFRTHPSSLKANTKDILKNAGNRTAVAPIYFCMNAEPMQVNGCRRCVVTNILQNIFCKRKSYSSCEELPDPVQTSPRSSLSSERWRAEPTVNPPSCAKPIFLCECLTCGEIKKSVSDGECGSKQGKQRYRQCLVPLMIPPPGTGQESRGAVLFRSLLRTPVSGGDDVPYTPPPMLSPVRPGSGLFSAVNAGTESHHNVLHSSTNDALTSGQKVINVTPRINIGEEFQAKIPEISQTLTEEDTHNAVLLWMPIKDLDTSDNQQKMDNMLKMACSSILPGGGTNTEYVLHCLFDCRGDIMNTLEKLLLSWRNTSGPKPDYHYAGSDSWSPQEKRLLNKALLTHHKDFYLVQKVVKTKTVCQCVEYYYTWKKRLRLGTRVCSALTTPVQDQQGDWTVNLTTGSDRETKSTDNSHTVFVCEVSQTNGKAWNQNNPGLLCSSPAEHRTSTLTPLGSGSVRSSPSNSTTSGDTDSAVVFPCNECGKVFFKVKSRNAHMKTHRQHEDTHLWQFPRVPEQDNGLVSSGCPVTPLKQPTGLHSADSIAQANAFSLNDVETVRDVDRSLKTVLQSQMDYIQS